MKSTQKFNPELLPTNLKSQEWPTAVGGVNFRKEDISGVMAETRHRLYDTVRTEIDNHLRELERLQEYLIRSERMFKARIGFRPTPGHTYHLYGSPEDWVSLVGPEEWERDDYVGSFRFDGRGWEKVK